MPGPHPLQPLSAEEVTTAAATCLAHARAQGLPPLRFNTVMLEEPDKAVLLPFLRGAAPPPPRVALVVLILPRLNKAAEALVLLAAANSRVIKWTMLDGVQPLTNPDDNAAVEIIAKKDPRVIALIKERYGVEDMSKVILDPWSVHGPPEHLQDRRLMQGFFFLKLSPFDNEYAHPLDLTVIVDLNEEKVVQLDMYDTVPALPLECHNYHRDLQTVGFREAPKPLDIVQSQGPSFSVEGHHVQWQKWDLCIGFNPREGLVLHQVGYQDQGKLRPVLYRASLVEMCVPYGSPDFPYTRKCAFDLGDYGFGFSANSLELGCDCLGHIQYFDAVVNNAKGEPVTIKNAICLHEEDAGVLWKHYDYRSNVSELRRSRRLVISMIATFMNYEYATYWYLYQDGTIQYDVKLTGVLSTHPMAKGQTKAPYGTVVAEGCDAAYHQHLFCVRLDPAVDDVGGGRSLVVSEVDAEVVPRGPLNPTGNAFRPKETDLTSTSRAQRVQAPEVARTWKVRNPSVMNPVCGSAVAYKLYPTACAPLMACPDSLAAQRGVFTQKNLFVTPYHPDQRFPAGAHVVQSSRDLGLGEWLKEDKPLLHSDPVLWYCFSATHFPRCEDWPVMPAEALGFQFRPCNFFTHNPGLDIPPERDDGHKGASCVASPMSKM